MTLEEKIAILETLAISKIIHLSLVTNAPTDIVNATKQNTKELIWNRNNPKSKHSTLCNRYEQGD